MIISDPSTKESDRQLLIDSRAFARENRLLSWWHLLTTLAALALCLFAAGYASWPLVRLAGSLMSGLVLVRMFILYHDFQHNSIFVDSRIAKWILNFYGYVMLTPPSVWRRSHNYHHQHNSKLFGLTIGTFPIMTTDDFEKATPLQKFEYRLSRNPIIMVLGYLSVFLWGMCLRPMVQSPNRHLDAIMSMVIHLAIILGSLYYFSWFTTLLVVLLPTWVATTVGAYLFYAQHNFPDAKIRDGDEWSYTDAALRSSSFMTMGPIMHWLTGNIGYHHVHHLNAKIPFYRLPEAMARLPRLQTASRTSLSLADIRGCLRIKLWDPESDRLVPFQRGS